MTQQQEMWYRHNLARRQAMMAAIMRMRYSAAGGSSSGTPPAPADEGIVVPPIEMPEYTRFTLSDGSTSFLSDEPAALSDIIQIECGRDMLSVENYSIQLSFDEIVNLSNIIIPDGTLKCEFYKTADENPVKLKELTIPNTVTELTAELPSLETLKIGSGVSSMAVIDEGTGEKWCSLYFWPYDVDIQISKDNRTYKTQNGLLLTKDGTEVLLDFKPSMTDVVIPDGVTTIGQDAFSGCTGLTDVTIPDGVTTIGSGAFKDCSGFTSVTIPEGVTSIGDYAFGGCAGLTDMTIPEGVTTIGSGAFAGCAGLTGVTIPAGVTTIGDWTFYGCTALTGVIIPAGVTTIGSGAFRDCDSLTSVTIPAGVESIQENAFYNCPTLQDVYIDKSAEDVQAMENGPWGLGQSDDGEFSATIHCSDGDIVINDSNSTM